MERVAVIADVHADWPALRSVSHAVGRAGIDRVWCLGDFACGGPAPRRAFDWVLGNCELVLAGNHELLVRERASERRHPPGVLITAAASAFRELGRKRVDRLYGLDAYAVSEHAELVHGALTSPADGYVSSRQQAERNLSLLSRPLLVFAHTHQAALWQPALRPGALRRRLREDVEYSLELSAAREHRRLLNPGAVCDPQGARWLELAFASDGSCAIASWHRTGVGGGCKPPANPRPNGCATA